jgi:hypothetical protein
MTLIKTTLSAIAVAGGLAAAILGATPASDRRILERRARRVDLDVGWALGRVEERLLHHAVVEHQHRWWLDR